MKKTSEFEQVLNQKRDDKDKIYALHALEAACIARGKEHKKYEFGSKVSFSVAQQSNVILAAVNFKGNPNDNKTLEKTLKQQERLTGVKTKNAFVDRGYKARRINGTQVVAPGNGIGKTKYEKSKLRKRFRSVFQSFLIILARTLLSIPLFYLYENMLWLVSFNH
jgi:IS5 family transposase